MSEAAETDRRSVWWTLLLGSAEARNVGWLGVERAVQLVVAFAVGPFVARHLGPSDYGLLAYAVAVTLLLTPFLSVGESLVIRDLAGEVAPAGVVLGAASLISAAATLVAVALLLGLGIVAPGTVPPGATSVVLIVLVGSALKPVGVVDWWLQSRLDARRATIAREVAMILGATSRIVAIIAGATLSVFAWLVSGEAALATTLLLIAYRTAGGRLSSWSLQLSYLASLSRQALPLLAAGLSVILYMRIDQVMLGALSETRENALYAIAVNLSEVTWFLPVAAMNVMMPSMTRLWQRDPAAATVRLGQVLTGAAFSAYVVTILSAIAGPVLIPLMYGNAFYDVVPVFLMLTLTNVFVYLGVVQTIWTVNERKQGLALARTAAAAVLNIALNLILLPRYGAVGAAITTLVSYAVGGVAGNLLSPRSLPIWRMQMDALRLRGLRSVLSNPALLREQ